MEEATAGDSRPSSAWRTIAIGDTISDFEVRRALPRVHVDEPTLQMVFGINTSPLAGRDGKYLTSRHLRERLMKELEKNVALRVEFAEGADSFAVSGRGLLHLSVLIETMRREGFELADRQAAGHLARERRRDEGAVRVAGGRSAARTRWAR